MTQSASINSVLEDSKQSIKDLNNKKITATPRNIIFGIMIFVGIIFTSMLALKIISGIFALFAIVIGAVALFLGLRFLKAADPLIKTYTQNLILSKMIENAKKYKMETLLNRVITSQDQLNEKRDKRSQLLGFLNKLKKRLDESDKESSTYSQKLDMYNSVKRGYDVVEQSVDRAGKVHKSLEIKVAEYKDMEEFTGIITNAMSLINDNGGKKLDDMLSLEAFNEIENEFNEAMAQIDNSVRDFETDNS